MHWVLNYPFIKKSTNYYVPTKPMIIHYSIIESSTGRKMKNKHKKITLFGDVKVGSEMAKGKLGKHDYMKFVGEHNTWPIDYLCLILSVSKNPFENRVISPSVHVWSGSP